MGNDAANKCATWGLNGGAAHVQPIMRVMQAVKDGSWTELTTVAKPYETEYRDTGFTPDGQPTSELTRVHYDGDPWWLTWSKEDAEKRKIAITTAKAAREAEALAEKEQEQQQAIARQAAKLQRRKARDDAKRAQQRTLVL